MQKSVHKDYLTCTANNDNKNLFVLQYGRDQCTEKHSATVITGGLQH